MNTWINNKKQAYMNKKKPFLFFLFAQYSLRQEPYIDTRGQRPIPATI